jgi:hypothetical protein
MLQQRNELENNLIKVMKDSKLKFNKQVIEDIKNHLRRYKVLNMQNWINDPESEVPKLEPMELFLLTEQIFLKTGSLLINPEDYFTEHERKKSRQYIGTYELEEEITFPYTLENVSKISNKEYSVVVPADFIAKLCMSRKLHYNFGIQRESMKRKVKGEIIEEPKLIMQNVLEIQEYLEKGKLKPTQIIYNAAIGTADADQPELIFDEQEHRLTITKGVILDVLDGFHRTKGTELAYHKKGHLDSNFVLLITNYSDDEAKNFQGQIAKATPIAVERAEELLGERMSDEVLKEMLPKTELQDKVSDSWYVHKDTELVSYKVLAETIEKEFNLEKMVDVYKVSNFLTKMFNYLMGTFEEEFLKNAKKVGETNLINNNNIFAGYIVLGRRLMELKADPSEIINIVSNINFEKTNKLWKEINVLDDKMHVTPSARDSIITYFRNIEILGYEKVSNNG